MTTRPSPNISKKEAIKLLWSQGDLSYKLKGIQKEMRDAVYTSKLKTTVFLVSRQSGKSFTMCTIANEYCQRNPNVKVLLLFPKKKDAARVAKEHMRKITSDCPPHLQPEYMVADKTFVFPNGSEIVMAGTDGGSAESIRGSTLNLVLMDEAGFHDYNEFQYIVTSIIIPTLTTTKGKIIMASTPSKEPDHPFMINYVEPFRADGNLIEYDVYSNPLLDEQDIEDIADNYPQGKEDPDFQREFLLMTNVASSLMVVPEFNGDLEKDTVVACEMPAYYDGYESCDPAVVDSTGILFGYWDSLRQKLVIMDELVLGGVNERTLTTQDIADGIHRKEKKLYMNRYTGEIQKPYMRIMDNNLPLLINDLYDKHNLHFIATKKDKKEDKVNQVRMMLKRGQIEIWPNCKNLIAHIKTAKWNNTRTGFLRNKGNKAAGVKPNHSDLLDALIYMVRNLQMNRNPFPEGYGQLSGDGIFQSRLKMGGNGNIEEIARSILNIKKN